MYITYRGARVYYKRTSGEGSPILFLHGWGGSSESFMPFAKGKNSLLIDFPPFGRSCEPKVPYTLEDYAIIVQKILNKEKLACVDVVAHSFGGRVAIWLASKTSLVGKLVLTGSAGLKPRFSLAKWSKQCQYKVCKSLVKIGFIKSEKLKKFGSSDYKALSDTMKKTFVNIVNFYQNDMLKDIKCATLLIWGKKDSETPIYFAKQIKRHLTDCGLIIWEGCGHFAYLQKPYDFAQILNNFF